MVDKEHLVLFGAVV